MDIVVVVPFFATRRAVWSEAVNSGTLEIIHNLVVDGGMGSLDAEQRERLQWLKK